MFCLFFFQILTESVCLLPGNFYQLLRAIDIYDFGLVMVQKTLHVVTLCVLQPLDYIKKRLTSLLTGLIYFILLKLLKHVKRTYIATSFTFLDSGLLTVILLLNWNDITCLCRRYCCDNPNHLFYIDTIFQLSAHSYLYTLINNTFASQHKYILNYQFGIQSLNNEKGLNVNS